jgi:hypothetical protein
VVVDFNRHLVDFNKHLADFNKFLLELEIIIKVEVLED